MTRKLVRLEHVLVLAGVLRPEPVDQLARALKAAGVPVTRNSRGQWCVDSGNGADAAIRVIRDELPPPGPVHRGTGRHVFPDETRGTVRSDR